jgi:hypothetical protein
VAVEYKKIFVFGLIVKAAAWNYEKDVPITEEVVAVIAERFDQDVVTLLLDRRGEDVRITEAVVKAAAENSFSGKEVMTVLLNQESRVKKELKRSAHELDSNGI